jgi:2-isopropylmalate synthase
MLQLYNHLVVLGFKQIEVGFPLSCEADWQFTGHVIEHDLIPDDVTIQVMSPIRDGMIERTVESIRGAPNRSSASATSPLTRGRVACS